MAKGVLEGWLDGIVERASKIIAEEGIPAIMKVDRVLDAVEEEARKIKKRSEVLRAQAEIEAAKEQDRIDGVVDAEVVEPESK